VNREKLNQSEVNSIAYALICSGLGTILGLVSYLHERLVMNNKQYGLYVNVYK